MKITYEYDALGQLVRENNLYLGETIVYTYDNGGNPENYRGKTLNWTARTLDSITETGADRISYRYDSSGLRTGKTVGNVESTYYYTDGLLAYEKRGGKELYYLYDSEGNLAEIQYVNGSTEAAYYPALNSRGDVEALYDSAGELKARYIYDSWGKVISVQNGNGTEITDQSHIGHVNPIRYRGYYYDTETGFYYVSSRYYDPEVGRFLNADGYITTGQGILSYNMFAYCQNNPVMYTDPTGTCITNAMGMTIHYNCKYAKKDSRRQFSVLESVSKETIDGSIYERTMYGVKTKTGVSVTKTKKGNKTSVIQIGVNITTDAWTGRIDGALDIKNNLSNREISVGSGGISYTKGFAFGYIETHQTYSVTNECEFEYRGGVAICWDNTDIEFYTSIGISPSTIAAAFALMNVSAGVVPNAVPATP